MMNLSTIVDWFPHDFLTVSAVLVGGAIIAVTLYTYLYDYAAQSKR